MAVDELRALPLLDGLDDDQLAALAAAGEEVAFEPGDELFRGGQPADVLVAAARGQPRPGPAGRQRGHRARHDEQPRPVGRRVPGLGPSTASTWRPAGPRRRRPDAAGAAPRRWARWPRRWFPFGVHLIQGLIQTVRNIESTARQREALVALGTLAAGLAHEINNPASAATRAVDALRGRPRRADRRRCAGWPRPGITAEQLRRSSTRCGSAAAAPDTGEPAGPWPTGRTSCPTGWSSTTSARTGWSRRRSPRPARTPSGASGSLELLGATGLDPALHWVANSLTDGVAARRGQGVDPAGVEPGRRGPLLLPARPGVGPAHRRHRGAGEHADGAGPQAAATSRSSASSRDVPEIEAIAGELNQVWTNLIDNAIDAMDGARHAAGLGGRRRAQRRRRDRRHRDRASPPTSSPTCSSRSSRPRTSAAAPDWGWTSPGGSSSTGTAVTSPWSGSTTRPCSGSGSRGRADHPVRHLTQVAPGQVANALSWLVIAVMVAAGGSLAVEVSPSRLRFSAGSAVRL